MSVSRVSSVILLASATISAAKLTWADTKFFMAFGDSYTWDSFNISAGVNSPTPSPIPPGATSSDGLGWVGYLTDTFNITPMTVFDLADAGATINASLAKPFEPTVHSFIDQVALFQELLATKPPGAEWSSNNTMFAIFFGVNDVGNNFVNTNLTGIPDFQALQQSQLFQQTQLLYDAGARNFLFLTVSPTDRAPIVRVQGRESMEKGKLSIANWNNLLKFNAIDFQDSHPDAQVLVFDTQPVFNTLIDNPEAFGFVNVTGFCEAYENNTATTTTQVEGCLPVSSYFWLNSLHPTWPVHFSLAHAISTLLSRIS